MRPPGSTRIAASERPVQNPESPGAACTPGLRGGEWLPLVRSSVAAADQSFRRRACEGKPRMRTPCASHSHLARPAGEEERAVAKGCGASWA